jgi:hypothetical protein
MSVNPTTAVLEFEDNWGKATETKAPEKPVRIAPPVNKDLEPEDEEPEIIQENQQPEPQKEKAFLSSSLSAEFSIIGIDTVQSVIFKMINNRKIVRRCGRENIERFGDLLTDLIENKKQPETLSETDRLLFLKFKRLKQIEDDIPFTDDEYKQLTEAIEKYFEETGQGLPPWFGLSIALAGALGARLSDAISE